MDPRPTLTRADSRCGATLRQGHGVSVCDLPADHEGKHSGWCDSCVMDGDDARLSWDQGVDRWPI